MLLDLTDLFTVEQFENIAVDFEIVHWWEYLLLRGLLHLFFNVWSGTLCNYWWFMFKRLFFRFIVYLVLLHACLHAWLWVLLLFWHFFLFFFFFERLTHLFCLYSSLGFCWNRLIISILCKERWLISSWLLVTFLSSAATCATRPINIAKWRWQLIIVSKEVFVAGRFARAPIVVFWAQLLLLGDSTLRSSSL